MTTRFGFHSKNPKSVANYRVAKYDEYWRRWTATEFQWTFREFLQLLKSAIKKATS
jgi:hypothetical protein